MLSRAWNITLLYLQQVAGNRSTFIQLLLVPLILTFILGKALAAPNQIITEVHVPFSIVNQDQGQLGQVLIDALETDSTLIIRSSTLETAQQELEADDTAAMLVIPADFSQALLNNQSIGLDYRIKETNADNQYIQQTLNTTVAQMAAALQTADITHSIIQEISPAATTQDQATQDETWRRLFLQAMERWNTLAPVAIEQESVTRIQDNSVRAAQGFNQSSPGLLVMFGLLFMVGGGTTLLQERENGTLRRFLVMPVRKSTILLGKMIGIFIGGLLQIGILIGAAYFFFGVNWGQAPLALLAIVISFALAASSLGLMMAALSRTTAQLGALSTMVVLAISALGGAWWPLEVVPPWMQQLGHVFPTAWAMDGFNDILTRGLGLEAVLQETFVLLGFAALFFIIGVWRFRFTK